MEKKYIALRTIGTIYKLLGVIVAVVALLSALGVCLTSVLGTTLMADFERNLGVSGFSAMGIVTGIIAALVVVFYGAAISVTLYAFGEAIYVLIELEENTRATVRLLEQQVRMAQPPVPRV